MKGRVIWEGKISKDVYNGIYPKEYRAIVAPIPESKSLQLIFEVHNWNYYYNTELPWETITSEFKINQIFKEMNRIKNQKDNMENYRRPIKTAEIKASDYLADPRSATKLADEIGRVFIKDNEFNEIIMIINAHWATESLLDDVDKENLAASADQINQD